MQAKQKLKFISILLILSILVSGISFNYELAYSLFPCTYFSENNSTLYTDDLSDANNKATIEESLVSRLSFYTSKSNKRISKNSRLVSFLYCESIFSQSTNFFVTSLYKICNIASSNDVIIQFIHRQDGKK